MTKQVDCPTCGKGVPWIAESRWRPFCSERCKLVDLGEWAAERNVIAGSEGESTPSEPGAADPQASLRRAH